MKSHALLVLAICFGLVAVSPPPPVQAQKPLDEYLKLYSQYKAHLDAERYGAAEPGAKQMLAIAQRSFADKPAAIAISLTNLAVLYYLQRRYDEAEPLLQRALKIREKVLGPDHADVAKVLALLAPVYDGQGRYNKAELLYQRLLKIREKVHGREHPEVTEVLSLLVTLYAKQHDTLVDAGRYREAEPIAKKMVAVSERAFRDKPTAIAGFLNVLANLYKNLGRHAEAEPLFQRALRINETTIGLENSTVADDLNDLALLYVAQSRYAEAESLFKRSMKIYEKVHGVEHHAVASSLNNLAAVYKRQARHDEAKFLYQRSLKIYEKVFGPDHPDVAGSLNNLAGLYVAEGRFAEAEPLLRRALNNREKTHGPDHPDVAASLNNLAILTKDQGRYAEAEPLYHSSLKIREKVYGPDHPDVADSVNNLAILYMDLGNYDAAESLYRRALKIREKNVGPEHPDVAASLNNLAILYDKAGRYAEAQNLHQRALKIREKVHGPEHPDVAGSLLGIANLHQDQNRHTEAELFYRRALKIREQSLRPDHPHVADSLVGLANSYQGQGRFAEAEPLYRRALNIHEKVFGPEHPAVTIIALNLARQTLAQRGFAEAEALYQRVLNIREKVYGHQHPDVAQVLVLLAILYQFEERYAEAETIIDRVISIRARAGVAPDRQYRGHKLRAEIAWQQDRKSNAIDDLHHAMQLAEQQRGQASGAEQERATAFAGFASAFELMVAWQSELGDHSEAFSAVERSRARSLQDQMALRGVDLLAGLPPNQAKPLRDRENKAKVQVASVEKQINILPQRKDLSETEKKSQQKQLREELKQAREELIEAYVAIRNASPAYRLAVGSDRKPVSLAKLQTWVAESDCLLLEYFLGEKAGYLFIVPAEGEAELVTLSVTEEQAEKLGIEAGPLTAECLKPAFSNDDKTGVLDLLHNPTRAEEAAPKLAVLWDLLIPAEIRDTITGGELKKLIIVPDGPLALLPFETLVVTDDQAPEYLLDVAPPIIHGPSATILYNLAQLAKGANGSKEPVLTIGDPAYPNTGPSSSRSDSALAQLTAGTRYSTVGGQLARLPYSGTESNWVASVFERDGAIKSKRLTGDQATESNLRANSTGRRWLHLACHGQADQKYGNFFGALALAKDKGADNPADDGFLTLPEIYELNLKGCELSILSACQTNYGPQQKGEGVWALSRGFLVAGSKRVVASNWLVDDKAAASLISYFCSGVAQAEKKNEPPDYAQKLHAAKKWVRNQEQWQSPYYWGTFVLVGPN